MKFLTKSFNKKIDAKGLALFRIVYSFFLLWEIINFSWYEELVFSEIPYIINGEIDLSIAINIWGVIVFFVMIGAFTRVTTIINYILTVSLLATLNTYEYHVHLVYLGVNFLMMFTPVSTSLSIDRLRKTIKFSTKESNFKPPNNVSQIYYWIYPLVAIGFVYFDSIFNKYDSYAWSNGLGMWIPASIPMFSNIDITFLLNNKYLMLGLGYLTVFIETIFIFTFYFRKFRLPLFFIGSGLHLGIAIAFPIPLFGLCYLSIYLLLVPVKYWKINIKIRDKEPRYIFFYKSENKFARKWANIIDFFDWFNFIKIDINNSLNQNYSLKIISSGSSVDGYLALTNAFKACPILSPIWLTSKTPLISKIQSAIYSRFTNENLITNNDNKTKYIDDSERLIFSNLSAGKLKFRFLQSIIIIMTCVQLLLIYDSPIFKKVREFVGVRYSKLDYALVKLIKEEIKPPFRLFLGMQEHHVFVDGHFSGNNHAIAVIHINEKGKETWLPITKKDGTPGEYIFGPNWVKYCFRVNGPGKLNYNRLEKGLRDFSAFWAKHNDINLNERTKFIVRSKRVETPHVWEKDFLTKQKNKPWIDAGSFNWENNEVSFSLKEIEDL